MKRQTILLSAMFALAATGVEAQQRVGSDSSQVRERGEARRVGGSMRRMRAPRMRMGGSPARALLSQRERLQLTDEQVRRLESLATQQRQALRPNEPEMLRARADLMEAMQRDNIAGARSAMERMARLRTDVSVARLQARKQTRDILSAEQRARVDEARRTVMDRRAGGRRPSRGMREFGRRERRHEMGPRMRGLVGPRAGAPRLARPPRERRF